MNSPSSPVARDYFLRVDEKPWERGWFELIIVIDWAPSHLALLACSVLATNPWQDGLLPLGKHVEGTDQIGWNV